jgi:hypothetical protein
MHEDQMERKQSRLSEATMGDLEWMQRGVWSILTNNDPSNLQSASQSDKPEK